MVLWVKETKRQRLTLSTLGVGGKGGATLIRKGQMGFVTLTTSKETKYATIRVTLMLLSSYSDCRSKQEIG